VVNMHRKLVVSLTGFSSTLAGSGIQGNTNGTGTSASFAYPNGVALDKSGNVYVADVDNGVIRKITPEGLVSNFTPRTLSLGYPYGVAVDDSGNLYVADNGPNLITKIAPSGVAITLAGGGTGVSTNGIGTAASFNHPIAIAVNDSGNVYVVDLESFLIRKITPNGNVTTLAGGGPGVYVNGIGTEASFSYARGVAADDSGNVYVADSENNVIRKISPTGLVTTLAGSGTGLDVVNGIGTDANFNNPYGVAVDSLGNVYVADAGNNLIRKITSGGFVTTLAGSGVQGFSNGDGENASFNFPSGVAVDDSGNVYVADLGNNLIRKITISNSSIESSITLVRSVSEMKLFPIPATNQLTLGFTLENESEVKLELINTSGNLVSSTNSYYGLGYHELTISVQLLPAGLYVANIYANSQMTSQKVVVMK
jgi:serine/threonine-protein kinase